MSRQLIELQNSLNLVQANLQQETNRSAVEMASASEKLTNVKAECEEKLSEAKNQVTEGFIWKKKRKGILSPAWN